MSEYEGLSDEEVRAETELLRGVPTFNIGALFLPPIWGPGHGMIITIIWYPLWLLADNCFYLAYRTPEPVWIAVAVLVGAMLTAATFVFARLAQPYALHRAIEQKGKTKEQYLKAERIWAIVCVLVGIAMIIAATYYNIAVRPVTFG